MRKKAVALFVIVGLAALLLPMSALAAENDQQVITGNPVATMAITAPSDNTSIAFTVGGDNADEDDDADNTVTCQSNVEYDVKINCDVTGNKTTAFMWEWSGAAYVESGEKLQTAMSSRTGASSYAAITGTATAIPGYTDKTATDDDGDVTYVDYKQPVSYGDARLPSNVYRHELTYTIVNSV
jgi:hypothetical protein